MKKLLIAGAATAALVSPAFAQGSGQITGIVQPTCEVQDLFAQQAFDSLSIGEVVDDGFTILCNDEDGATLRLTSVAGGLRADDDVSATAGENTLLQYTAVVSVTGVPAFDGLSLITDGSANQSVQASSDDSTAAVLASGTSGEVLITLNEDAIWAGGYSDTIQLDVIAN